MRKVGRAAIGLALLYASAFYLPVIGSYFLPAVGRQILYPSAITVLVLTPAIAWFLSRDRSGARSDVLGVVVVAILCWVAIVGAFSAAGYSALGIALLVSTSNTSIEVTRWVRVAMVFVGVVTLTAVVYAMRGFWQQILRLLSIIGYAYALLAVIRLNHYPREAFMFQDHRPAGAANAPERMIGAGQISTATGTESRQVIWIILDELDYNQTLGIPGGPTRPTMPNLEHLAHLGVSASNAYSPAKDTVASLPALLTGYPLAGLEFKDIDLWLKTRHAGVRRFQESDSVFGRLPGGPQSAAIIGFYHPYCSLFPSVDICVSSVDANTGRWFDSLLFFSQPTIAAARWLPASGKLLPGFVFRAFEPMYRITEDTLREIPSFLSLEEKSLVFLHVNLPHPPGDYSQRALRLTTVGDDRESYRRNLQLVDQIIGKAVSILEARSKRQDILLIVSSDHWHRIDSPLTAQRIPWIAWHVGESAGSSLEAPISTVHTADLVLDFLQGRVGRQTQIVSWWQNKTFEPSLMPHGYEY